MNRYVVVLCLALIALPFTTVNAADIPRLMNYQGNVEDANGVPVSGDGYFKFAIVNAAADTAYWANDGVTLDGSEPTTAVTIPVSSGLFSVKLGNTDLINMTALSDAVFDNTSVYLRVWFSFDGTNFELFSPDTQIVSTGFAFKAQVANSVANGAITTDAIEDGTITDTDINANAAISGSKIDSTGLDSDTLDGHDSSYFSADGHAHANVDADTLDGNDSTDFATSVHVHTNVDADTLDSLDSTDLQARVTSTCVGQVMVGINSDGSVNCEPDDIGTFGGDADTLDSLDSTDFSLASHGHAHSSLSGVGASDHHFKTESFSELVDTISDVQIPLLIARDSEIMPTILGSDGSGSGLDADTVDGMDSSHITSNTSNIAANESSISSNTSNIAANESSISSNTSNIAANASSISSNTLNIVANASSISTNTTDISTKQNQVTGTCPAGYSIREINVDGGVACELDNDSGGDITGITTGVGSGLDGGVVSGTANLSIDATDFNATPVSKRVTSGNTATSSSTTFSPFSSETINIPAAGYVVATVNAHMYTANLSATNLVSHGFLAICDSSVACSNDRIVRLQMNYNSDASAYEGALVSNTDIIYYSSGGSKTINAEVRVDDVGDIVNFVLYGFTLFYIPQ